jgi:phage terminase small subunit
MPVLANPRHEAFVNAMAKGLTAEKAYVKAGYKANRHNAAALAREEHISTRLAELQSKVAERTLVTVQSLTDELEEARAMAVAEKQSSAAVAATLGKAKLHGLLVDKKRFEGPNGGPVQVDLTGYTTEQLKSYEKLFAQLASAAGSDTATGEGGDSET